MLVRRRRTPAVGATGNPWIRARYERGAMVLTSDRAVEEWYPLFRDALMASAAMDRLLHRAHVVVMEGDSYRNPPAGRRAP